MWSRGSRRSVLVAALLVLPLLALTVGTFASHEGHGCHFEKDCLACRWAADTVVEATTPAALPQPIEAAEVPSAEPAARVADASPEAASSRGPPLS
jgi:hypothetical protein